MKRTATLFLTILTFLTLSAQEWYNDYGEDNTDRSISNFIDLDNGDLAILLSHQDVIDGPWGSSDLRLSRTDDQGQVIWEKEISRQCFGNSLVQTNDGGFIIVGTKIFQGITNILADIVLFRTDSAGNVLWEKKYENIISETGWGIIAMENEEFIISGIHNVYGIGTRSLILKRIDSNGDVIWTKLIQNASLEGGAEIIPSMNDDGFIVASSIGVNKFNNNGELIWSRIYGGDCTSTHSSDIAPVTSGGYIYPLKSCAEIDPNTLEITNAINLFRLDDQGETLWNTTLELQDTALFVSSVIEIPNCGFVISGEAYINSNESDLSFYAEVDFNGEIQALQLTDLIFNSTLLYHDHDQQVIMSGYKAEDTGDIPFLFSLNDLVCSDVSTSTIFTSSSSFSVTSAPNPATSEILFNIKNFDFQNTKMILFDQLGRKVWQQAITQDSFILPRNQLKSGVYFYVIQSNEQIIYSHKIIFN